MTTQAVGAIYQYLLSGGFIRTKADFARRIGVSRPFVSQLISGKSQPPAGIEETIAAAFPQVDIEAVLLTTVSSGRAISRQRDGSRKPYVNRYGVRFVPLTDGSYIAHHKKIPHAAHAAAAAGWGDPEYTESLPESTTVVAEPSEDNIVTFEVVGHCQDDGTKEAISEGDEITGRSYPRDMWRYKLPFEKPETKPLKVRTGKGEIKEVTDKRRYPYWVFIDRQHGIHIGMIKSQDVEKGVLYCACRNPDKKNYPDFEIRLDDCTQILYVVDLKHNF